MKGSLFLCYYSGAVVFETIVCQVLARLQLALWLQGQCVLVQHRLDWKRIAMWWAAGNAENRPRMVGNVCSMLPVRVHGSICRFSSKVLNKSRRARWNGKTAAFVLKTSITAENVSGVLTSVLLFFSWEPTCSSLSPSLVYSVDAICNFYTLSAEMIIGDLESQPGSL